MKSLKTVQTISKVMSILALIGLIFTFIGVGACALGGIAVLSLPFLSIVSEDVAEIFLDFQIPVTLNGCVTKGISLIAESVFLVSTGIVAVFTYKYFKNELKDGTPFTKRGANELLRLGIITIVVPIAGIIGSEIIYFVGRETVNFIGGNFASNFFGSLDVDFSNEIQVSLGVAFILLSFVFRYGAELEEKLKGAEKPVQTVDFKTEDATAESDVKAEDTAEAVNSEASETVENKESIDN